MSHSVEQRVIESAESDEIQIGPESTSSGWVVGWVVVAFVALVALTLMRADRESSG